MGGGRERSKEVKCRYGVRSPKFNWAPCAPPAFCLFLSNLSLIYAGAILLVSPNRRHLFVALCGPGLSCTSTICVWQCGPQTREYIDWRYPLLCAHSVMIDFGPACSGWGCLSTNPLDSSYIAPSTLSPARQARYSCLYSRTSPLLPSLWWGLRCTQVLILIHAL